MINFLYTKIKNSKPKKLISKQDVNDSLEILNKYPEAVLIAEYLKEFLKNVRAGAENARVIQIDY